MHGEVEMTTKKTGHRDAEIAARKNMSFAQAEGVEALPSQLKAGEITSQVRAYLWAIIWESLKRHTRVYDYRRYFDEPWQTIFQTKHLVRDHHMADEFANDAELLTSELKNIYLHGDYVQVLDLTQWILRQKNCPDDLSEGIKVALEMSFAAYTVLDGKTIMPISSTEEGETIAKAVAATKSAKLPGPRQHIKAAAEHLSGGRWADSIRESIHAVEAAARIFEPNANDLGPALTALEKKGKIHSAMKIGFAKLYGFTSDEDGIRHSLLEKGEAAVDQTDAQFMLGACAAFVSYLIARSRSG